MPSDPRSSSSRSGRRARGKLRRARVRHLLFTVGPDRLSGGRLVRRHANEVVHTRELTIASPRWPAGLDGVRIAHVSDFHLGHLLPLDRALAVAEQVADLEPDLVAVTGDTVDLEHRGAPDLFRALADIRASLGTFVVLGNHDELLNGRRLARIAEDAGCIVLENDAVRVVHGEHEMLIGGLAWTKSARQARRAMKQLCGAEHSADDGPPVDLLLAHNPKAFRAAADHGTPLTLAGHTHGGQVAWREGSDANLAFAHRRSMGCFEHEGSWLYITAGVGSWFPLRVNVPREIALLTVRHGADDAPPRNGAD